MIGIGENFFYREGSAADKEQMKHIGLISFGEIAEQLSPENRAKMLAALNDDAKQNELIRVSKSFVCEHKNEIVGMAFLIPAGNPWDIFPAEWSYIRMVGVDPEQQGKGIAKALTKMCIDYAKQTNEKIIALHTSELMPAARHVYESFGFKILRELEPRFGIRYWLYTLDLN